MNAKRNVRYLRAGDVVPEGQPTRCRSSAGYVWLRWSEGPGSSVYVYEHRLVAGLPVGNVHHKNGIKDDNRPENLEVISCADHVAKHNAAKRAYSDEEISALYAAGLSTFRISKRCGVDVAVVYRALVRLGVQTRTRSAAALLRRQQERAARMESVKMCGACHKVLPLTAFAKHRYTKDGKQTQCKACSNAKGQARRDQKAAMGAR